MAWFNSDIEKLASVLHKNCFPLSIKETSGSYIKHSLKNLMKNLVSTSGVAYKFPWAGCTACYLGKTSLLSHNTDSRGFIGRYYI